MKRFIYTILLLATCTSCTHRTVIQTDEFNIIKYAPQYARGFEIRSAEGRSSSLLVVRNPWQGADSVEMPVFLSRDGERPAADFDGCVVETPVQRMICMSSSYVATADALGEVRRVVGVSGIDFISNEYVNEHKLCGEVRDVGFDSNLDFELIVALRPDVVLMYGISGGNDTVTGKLAELGIPYIYIGDYVEEHPLGKAEWLRVTAELFDCRDKGDATFAGIAERYNDLAGTVAQVARRPKVMLNTPYRDTWFMPSTRSYMVRLVEDAGGEYIYPQNTGDKSLPVSLEEAYVMAAEADVWLNTGQYSSLDELKSALPRFANMPAVNTGRVYNNNARQTPAGGSDFWESGIVHPDVVLGDLIGILHPETATATEPYYYRQLK